ncbi:Heterokaryon incompatibility protein [Paramyrothecium foliicola]|nr:Heterokaryon incompatibility protein [Paramyrothecium foliicola]
MAFSSLGFIASLSEALAPSRVKVKDKMTSLEAGQHICTKGNTRGAQHNEADVWDTQYIFQQAINNFLECLADEHKVIFQKFGTASDVIAHIHKEILEQPLSKPFVTSFCNGVQRISHSLEPYFAIIDTFVQANPDIVALVWGALKLVFKVSSHFSTFGERLAGLLEDVAQDLAFHQNKYQVFLEAAKSLGQKGASHLKLEELATRQRLTTAISQLYEDILDMCLYLCNMFSCEGKGKLRTVKRLAKVFWTPFDVHFEQFHKRLKLHKDILTNELSNVNTQLLMNQLSLTEESVTAGASQLEIIAEQMKAERLMSLKHWLNPPQWQTSFEDIKAKRTETTSLWILDILEYKWWSEQQRDSSINQTVRKGEERKVLLLHGKPGYGKSVLCATIIEHLLSRSTKHPNVNKALPNTEVIGFFFFDKQSSETGSPQAAFRAIVAQIFHSSRNLNDLIDLALLLRDSTGSGQTIASDEEIINLLSLYLYKLDESTLVFDGLDECSDAHGFLRILKRSTSRSRTKVLISSRPNITIEDIFGDNAKTKVLQEDANSQDIEKYLQSELQDLAQREKLVLDESIESLGHRIARRSHSMFLWAYLMVQYLDSDFLTPQDRMDAIEEVNLFEELNEFYTKILGELFLRCVGKRARNNLQRLFRWVSLAARQLTVSEIRSALAIQAGLPTKKSRYMTRVQETICKMSGALIEVSSDHNVRFIHTSVLEFFLGSQAATHAASSEIHDTFGIDAPSVHAALAQDLLSYMLHDIPHEPLVVAFSHEPRPVELQKRFPLLLYSTQFWAYHAARCMNELITRHGTLLRQFLHDFISNKRAVTAWAEAAWSFGLEPSLGELSERINAGALDGSDALLHELPTFVGDLEALNKRWGHALSNEPRLIWQPSIPAFQKSKFWVDTNDSTTIALDGNREHPVNSNTASDPITIASRISEDGIHVGIIKLWPPKSFIDCLQDSSFNGTMMGDRVATISSGWTVRYDINIVQSQQRVVAIETELPVQQVAMLLFRAARSSDPSRFEFPVTLSSDLRQVVILTFLIRCRRYLYISILQVAHTILVKIETSTGRVRVCIGHPGDFTDRNLTVYRDDQMESNKTAFVFIAETTTRVGLHVEKDYFVFHPYEPALAIAGLAVTALWFFEDQPKPRWETVAMRPLNRIQFSQCGDFLYGENIRKLEMVPIKHFIQRMKPRIGNHLEIRLKQDGLPSDAPQTMALASVDPISSATVRMNSIVFKTTDAGQQVSILRKCDKDGRIFLRTLHDNGVEEEQCLTHLPRSSTVANSEATLLSNIDDNASLSNQCVYTAISYCWGNLPADRRLAIGDESWLPISSKVEDILTKVVARHAMAHLPKDGYHKLAPILWIDAICINQKDNAERASQVCLMADIYSHANSVDVWLDTAPEPSSPFSAVAIPSQWKEKEAKCDYGISREWDDWLVEPYDTPQITELMWCPWFTRA